MKKKFLLAILLLICAFTCAFSLVACNGNNTPSTNHTHDYKWVDNGDGTHKQHCSVANCGEPDINSDSHDFTNGNCVCGKQKPTQSETPAVLQPMDNSFSKAMAVYSTNEILDENGVKKSFSVLLDRQFDVLAEDILYRLYVTYGKDTYGEESTFGDLLLNNGNYALSNSNAKVVKNKLLTNSTSHSSNHLTNIDCIYCYQDFISNVSTSNTNRLNDKRYVLLQNAINGDYHSYYDATLASITDMKPIDSNGDGEIDQVIPVFDPTPYKWQFNDYSKWNTDYRNQFKYALAKIVYGNEQTSLSYNELLNKINHLGFSANDGEKIIDYINNSVIGANLIADNLRIYNMFSEADKSNLKNWTAENEIDKHYYKGYNIVVPAIVSQALGNTFDGTVGLYPNVGKQVGSVFEFDGLKTERDYKQIVLMPKNSDISITKISAKFYSANSQDKIVTVKATVKNAVGELVSQKTVGTVNLTAVGTAVELNIACVNTIGIYTGDLTSKDTVSLFGNNNNTVSLGDNYVELTFEYEDGITFGVEFNGMYDK